MNKREEYLLSLTLLQKATTRVMVVAKKFRGKKGEPSEMPPLASALLIIGMTECLDLEEHYNFFIFRTYTNALLVRSGVQGFESAQARAN